MNEVKPCKWAAAKLNQDFFCIETYSGYRSYGRDPEGAQHLLDLNANDEAIGFALQDALAKSRFLTLEQVDDFFDYQKNQPQYEAWVQALMQRYGYKTKRALFKSMMSCSIELMDEVITIRPSHHDKLEGWGREDGDGIEDVVIPANSSYEEIGAALRLAFSRCTN